MPFEFFVSYTRTDFDIYMKRFIDDLNEFLCPRRALPKDAELLFFDQRDIERGEEWDAKIAGVLQEASVMVTFYSPGYFKSPYCGKEWQLFHRRAELYQQTESANSGQNVPLPPVIKPVIWIPLGEPYPAEAAKPQYQKGEAEKPENANGVLYIIKQYSKYRVLYNDFVESLGQEMLRVANRVKLPRLEPFPLLNDVEDAFAQAAPPAAERAVLSGVGPDNVVFVCVAAKPDELSNVPKLNVQAYGERGGLEWKPFFPDRTKGVYTLAANVATTGDMNFNPEHVEISHDLANLVRAAERDRKIVIILLDCWTARLPVYGNILSAFDSQNYINCAVLVPWNKADQETIKEETALKTALGQTLFFRRKNLESVYYREDIASEDDLRDRLRESLIRLKAEVLAKAEVERELPKGGSLPTVRT